MAKLQVQESGGAREFELVDVEVSIGRELDNALRLPDPSISRHHAVIRQAGAGQLPQMPPRRPAPARQAPIPPEAAKPSGAGGLFQWFGSLFRRS